eukprot:2427415-Lingulodinium_polyedra.AAC.1
MSARERGRRLSPARKQKHNVSWGVADSARPEIRFALLGRAAGLDQYGEIAPARAERVAARPGPPSTPQYR